MTMSSPCLVRAPLAWSPLLFPGLCSTYLVSALFAYSHCSLCLVSSLLAWSLLSLPGLCSPSLVSVFLAWSLLSLSGICYDLLWPLFLLPSLCSPCLVSVFLSWSLLPLHIVTTLELFVSINNTFYSEQNTHEHEAKFSTKLSTAMDPNNNSFVSTTLFRTIIQRLSNIVYDRFTCLLCPMCCRNPLCSLYSTCL